MNSRERVQAAIARRPVDQVPLGLYAVDHDLVSKVLGRKTYVRNKVEMQIALWEGRRDEVVESLKKDTVEFYQKIDCVDLILPKEGRLVPPKDYEPDPPEKIAENLWEAKDGTVYKASYESNEMAIVSQPRMDPEACMLEEYEKPLELREPHPSMFEVIDYVYEHLGEGRYICTLSGGLSVMTLLGGMEHGLLMYGIAPGVVRAATRQLTDLHDFLDRFYIRNNAPGVLIEQDMASTKGPMLSPSMVRECCLPFLKERIANIKQYAPQVILHCCGNSLAIMDQFVDAGVDCYQSLQTTAGMDLRTLKARFGDHLCFWGGVATEVLITGTPDNVRKEVRRAMEVGSVGGGFILGPSHSVAFSTPYGNFMAMLDEYDRLKDHYT